MPALAWVGKRSVSWTNGQIGELLVQLSLIERRQGRTAAACVGSKLNGRGQLMMITVQHHHPYTTDVIALHGVGDAEWAGRFPSPSLGLLPLHGQYHPPGIGPTPDNSSPTQCHLGTNHSHNSCLFYKKVLRAIQWGEYLPERVP